MLPVPPPQQPQGSTQHTAPPSPHHDPAGLRRTPVPPGQPRSPGTQALPELLLFASVQQQEALPSN